MEFLYSFLHFEQPREFNSTSKLPSPTDFKNSTAVKITSASADASDIPNISTPN